MNGFRKLQERLTQEGWYVGWGLACCQSCAWMDVPDTLPDGTEVDLTKVLFNHEQDCELDDADECAACHGEGWSEETDDDCTDCNGTGLYYITEDGEQLDKDSYAVYPTNPPEIQDYSTFCFNGDKTGVENLKAILPIIKECGCDIDWDGKGDQRPTISWLLK